VAFIFKDVRIEPYLIRQIDFDNLTLIQQYLLSKGVYYIEDQDS